jgi:phosphoribosylaminoimidazole carboxylase
MHALGASVHWYNKGEARVARKMGHVNVVGPCMADVEARLAMIAPAVRLPPRTPLVGIIMGSDSDLPTLKAAAGTLSM